MGCRSPVPVPLFRRARQHGHKYCATVTCRTKCSQKVVGLLCTSFVLKMQRKIALTKQYGVNSLLLPEMAILCFLRLALRPEMSD